MVLWVVVAVVCVWRWWKRVIIQLKKKIKKSTQKEEKTKNKEDKTFESFGTRREWVGTHTCNIGNSGRIKAREVRGISR